MRALTYHGTRDVRVESVPDPVIQEADDVILRVTATAICGSDLHLYRGKIPATEQSSIQMGKHLITVSASGTSFKYT